MEILERDIDGERGTLAIDRLKHGEDVLLLRPISLTNFQDGGLTLLVWSGNTSDHWERDRATRELFEGKAFYEKLVSEWGALRNLVEGLEITCYLHHDYGMGSTRMAELKNNGEVVWLHSALQ